MRSESVWTERVAALAEEVVAIADRAVSKDDVAAAKLQIEARQWVVATYLLKRGAGREKDVGLEPISVTINADTG